MSALLKEAGRSIRKSIGEFFSIILMIAIAVLIFIGLKSAGESMDTLGWDLLRETKASDLAIESDFSLEKEDLKLLSSLKDVEKIERYFQLDVEDEKERGLRLESVTSDMNLPLIDAGRSVEKTGEIFLESVYQEDYSLGEKIKLSEVKGLFASGEDLKEHEFEIVGFGRSIDYIVTFGRRNTKVGGGEIYGFGLIHPEDFKLEDPKGVRINLTGTKDLDISSSLYDERTQEFYEEVKDLFKNRPEIRLVSLKDDLKRTLHEGQDEIQEAKEELKDAEEKISDGKEEIRHGFQELEDQRQIFFEEIQKNKLDLRDGRNKLEEGERNFQKALLDFRKKEDLFKRGEKDYLKGLHLLKEESEKLQEGSNKWRDSFEKFQESEKEFSKGKEELLESEKKLEEGRKELANARDEISSGWNEISFSKSELAKKERELLEAKSLLEENREDISKLEELVSGLEEVDRELAKIESTLEKLNSLPTRDWKEGKLQEIDVGIQHLQSELEVLKGDLDTPEDDILRLESQISEIQGNLRRLDGELNGLKASREELSKTPVKEDFFSEIQEAEEGQALLLQKKEELNSYLPGTLETAKKKITDYYSSLGKVEKRLSEIQNGKKKLSEKEKELIEGSEKLSKEESHFKEQEEKFLEGKKEFQKGEKKLQEGKKELEKNHQMLVDGKNQLEKEENKLFAVGKELEENWSKLEDGRKALEREGAKLREARRELEDGEETLAVEEEKGLQKLRESEKLLKDSQEEIRAKEEEFLKEKEKALREIKENEEKLNDLEESMDLLEKPVYQIHRQNNMPGIASYFDIVNRLPFISNFFPAFFFMIALLVSLTTMTRMVEEDRLQMGLLKALGYRKGQILLKYLIFALLASSLGVVLGRFLGYRIVAPIISKAYLSVVAVEDLEIQKNIIYTLQGAAISVGLAVLVTLLVSRRSLKEKPSELLRPRPPKAGSRIWLESVDFIWRRLNFIYKVTFRNLFRYKARMFMTIIGVAGCVGLLLLGFGIKDSIEQSIEKQFSKIIHYDYLVIHEEGDSKRVEEYKEKLEEWEVEDHLPGRVENLILKNDDGMDESIISLAFRESRLQDFVKLQNRRSKEEYSLEEGALITEGLANSKKLKEGDFLEFYSEYGEKYEVEVSDILENYLEHYLYLSDQKYEEVFGKEYIQNMDLVKTKKEDFANELLKLEGVYSLVNMDKASEIFDDLTGPLNNLVYVIIFFSAVLAFVVLYNLNSINISERKQELSTIKVLGFYNKEVTAYIYRETLFLSVIGMFLGFILGKLMHQIILAKLIPEEVLLDPQIHLMSYGLTTILFLSFLFIVMILVHRRLKEIDMLEALHED